MKIDYELLTLIASILFAITMIGIGVTIFLSDRKEKKK